MQGIQPGKTSPTHRAASSGCERNEGLAVIFFFLHLCDYARRICVAHGTHAFHKQTA
jgi:hypothetical protein